MSWSAIITLVAAVGTWLMWSRFFFGGSPEDAGSIEKELFREMQAERAENLKLRAAITALEVEVVGLRRKVAALEPVGETYDYRTMAEQALAEKKN